MGCCHSRKIIDFDIIQPLVLRAEEGIATYSGTSERGRYQTLGDAELALSEDCLYSQVIGTGCCGDQGLLRIPLLSIRDIEQHLYFNGRYRIGYPHMVITYIISDHKCTDEYQAAWQMSDVTFHQWKEAIIQLQNRYPSSELA